MTDDQELPPIRTRAAWIRLALSKDFPAESWFFHLTRDEPTPLKTMQHLFSRWQKYVSRKVQGRTYGDRYELPYLLSFEENPGRDGVHTHGVIVVRKRPKREPARISEARARWRGRGKRPFGIAKIEPFDLARREAGLRYILKHADRGAGIDVSPAFMCLPRKP